MRVKHFKCLPSGRKSGGTAELLQLRPFWEEAFFMYQEVVAKPQKK